MKRYGIHLKGRMIAIVKAVSPEWAMETWLASKDPVTREVIRGPIPRGDSEYELAPYEWYEARELEECDQVYAALHERWHVTRAGGAESRGITADEPGHYPACDCSAESVVADVPRGLCDGEGPSLATIERYAPGEVHRCARCEQD